MDQTPIGQFLRTGGNRETSPFSGPVITPDGRFVAFISRAIEVYRQKGNLAALATFG